MAYSHYPALLLAAGLLARAEPAARPDAVQPPSTTLSARDDADLLEALGSDDILERRRARRKLARRGPEVRPALIMVLRDSEVPRAARGAALGALESMWNADVQGVVVGVLSHGEAPLRRQAAEVLGRNAPAADKSAHAALLTALADTDPAVRRAAALAMSRVGAPGASDALVNTLAFEDSPDGNLREGLLRAVEGLGQPGIDRLVALADSGVQKDTDKAVAAFLGLRTRPAFEAIPALLANPHLSVAQRADLIRSCKNYLLVPPISLTPILDYLTANPGESPRVTRAGLEVLASSAALRGDKGAAWLLGLLDDADAAVRLSAIRALGNDGPAKAAPRLEKLAQAAATPEERTAAAKALRQLRDRR